MPSPAEISPIAWVLLAVASVIVGFSKTAFPGINTISIAIFAAILPARASTGTLLLLLIIGDVFALVSYRRHADWRTLARLLPAVVVGLGLGALFLAFADDDWVRRTIGLILLLLIAVTLWRRYRSSGAAPSGRAAGIARAGYGSLGGFTTMVANAGGPPIALYFLAMRFEVLAFLGTAAWFFAVINLVKVPIAIGIGIIGLDTLQWVLLLAPAVIAGALSGRWLAKRVTQQAFEWVVIVGTVLGALYLLVA